jgi:hypothetical protein
VSARRPKPSLEAWIDLYWLPLGAGGNCVRFNGRVYERILALREHRPPSDIAEAVDSPRRVSEDRSQVAAVLAALRHAPPLT